MTLKSDTILGQYVRVRLIYQLADTGTDTDISLSANWISVSVISVSVSANVDIGYIGIGKISVKIHRYRPNIGEISAKMPDIGKILVK